MNTNTRSEAWLSFTFAHEAPIDRDALADVLGALRDGASLVIDRRCGRATLEGVHFRDPRAGLSVSVECAERLAEAGVLRQSGSDRYRLGVRV